MKTISIINLKGGVGKTFTTIQMAHELATRSLRVLLIDNDKQGNLSKFYGYYQNTSSCTTAQMLNGTFHKGMIQQCKDNANIHIITANMSLLNATLGIMNRQGIEQYTAYKTALLPLQKDYDVCLIDNPPDISFNVINALAITDDVIIPVRIDEWALEGMGLLLNQIEDAKSINPSIQLAGILVTHFKSTPSNLAGVEWLKKHQYKTFKTLIRYSDKATESVLYHKPVREFSPRSAVAKSYKHFMCEYMGEV